MKDINFPDENAVILTMTCIQMKVMTVHLAVVLFLSALPALSMKE